MPLVMSAKIGSNFYFLKKFNFYELQYFRSLKSTLHSSHLDLRTEFQHALLFLDIFCKAVLKLVVGTDGRANADDH